MKSRRLYGVRRITAALKKGNTSCGHNRVARLMQEKGLRSLRKGYRRTTTNSNHNYPIAPNLLGRGYKATRPNQVWVSDITYVPTLGIGDCPTLKGVPMSVKIHRNLCCIEAV